MCFSASASFGASAVLGVIGVIAVKKSGNNQQRLFAAIPLLFAVQQLSEGFVWQSLMYNNPASWQPFFIHFFLFFAYVLWPVWIPLSMLLLEPNKRRQRVLRILLATGAVVALYVIVCLLLYPSGASVHHQHIAYSFQYPPAMRRLVPFRDGLYFIATLVASFVSSHKRMWLFGVVLIAAYLFSRIFFQDAVASVWCYFAAVLSVIVVFIVTKKESNPYTSQVY